MSDIVERLRAMASDLLTPHDRLALEAADEIERLESVLADFCDAIETAANKARKRIEEEPR